MAWVCDECHSVWSNNSVSFNEADAAICSDCGGSCTEEDLGDDEEDVV